MLQGRGPSVPPRPQYYNVACPEGHVLRGLRTEGYQALRCPTCGEGIFVLPRSPLPDPPRPPARSRPEADRPRPAGGGAGRRRGVVAEGPTALAAPPPMADAPAAEEADAEVEWLEPEPVAQRPEP